MFYSRLRKTLWKKFFSRLPMLTQNFILGFIFEDIGMILVKSVFISWEFSLAI